MLFYGTLGNRHTDLVKLNFQLGAKCYHVRAFSIPHIHKDPCWEGVLEPWQVDTKSPYLSRIILQDLRPELQSPEFTKHNTQQLPNYTTLPLTQIDNQGSAMVPIIESNNRY